MKKSVEIITVDYQKDFIPKENTDIEQITELIHDLAKLFPCANDMSELDASDFKDNAGKIWDLVKRARTLENEL